MKERVPYKAERVDNRIYSFFDIDQSLNYSYANYLNWFFRERVELIKGRVFKMSPAPSRIHQEVSVRLASALHNSLKNNSCKVYPAPFDVRFPEKGDDDANISTVLQPDICVVCDQTKLDDRGCLGAPDLIAEILSPGSKKMELLDKFRVYENFGVAEYWIVDPALKTVEVFLMDSSCRYSSAGILKTDDVLTSQVVPEFKITLLELFSN